MDRGEPDAHLSRISTVWTDLLQAHASSAESVGAAQLRLIRRYERAIYRYLLGALRDPDAADELYQEFALRFVRGDFRRADPGRGRFRDFLKMVLSHLITDLQRRRRRQPLPLSPEGTDPAADPPPPTEDDQRFLTIWRAELMACSWEALACLERQGGPELYTVLRLRVDHPELSASQMAERLAEMLGKEFSAPWVHKRLCQARAKFTDLLLEELALSVDDPTTEGLEEELLELGLLGQCRSALERRRRGTERGIRGG